MKTVIKLGAVLLLAASVPAIAGTLDTGVATPGRTTATVADDATPVAFSVFLPLRNTAGLKALVDAQVTATSPSYHKWLTSAQFAAAYGPTPAALQAAAAELTRLGFTVDSVGSRTVHVTGTAAQVTAAFGARLNAVQGASGPAWLVAGKALALTPALSGVGAFVPGFANSVPKISNAVPAAIPAGASPDGRNGPAGPYRFTELKEAYDYPAYNAIGTNGSQLDGTGARVAIVMSGDVLDSDIALQIQHENFTAVTGKPTPTLLRLPIDGGAPYDPNAGGTFEASLDTQAVIQGAPGATTTLVTIPDLSDTHILDAYAAIVDSNAYDIVSSSFSGAENFSVPGLGTNITQVYDELLMAGNAKGITWIASTGDQGGLGCPSVSYFNAPNSTALFVPCIGTPASDPHVTAVGGGNLVTSYNPATLDVAYVSENGLGDALKPYDIYGLGETVAGGYWGADGGQSLIWPRPQYQGAVYTGSTMRTVPDVGMLVGGCPGGTLAPCGPNRSSVIIYLGGRTGFVIGTSVSAPEFASAVAVCRRPGRASGQSERPAVPGRQGAEQRRAGGVSPRPAVRRRLLDQCVPEQGLQLHLRQRFARRPRAVRPDRRSGRRRAQDDHQPIVDDRGGRAYVRASPFASGPSRQAGRDPSR